MLNKTDRKILKVLQSDASLSRQDMLDATRVSATTLWRRITDLEEAGTIQKRVALLDPVAVGFPVCVFVSIDMKSHDRVDRDSFLDFVRRTPEIMECYSVTGAHDYSLKVRVESVADFEKLLMEQILSHKSVASATSQIALRQHKYSTDLPIREHD